MPELPDLEAYRATPAPRLVGRAALARENRTLKRALSRLLRGDWPKSLEELEERKQVERARSHGMPG